MIRHTINCEHFLAFVLNNASDIFMEFLFVFFTNEVLSPRHCKNNVYVDLCICVRHVSLTCRSDGAWYVCGQALSINILLLTELGAPPNQ